MNIKTIVFIVLAQVIISGLVFNAGAQEKIATYSMSALESKEPLNFDVSLGADNALWIDVFSAYEQGSRCGFKLDERYKSNFISTVKDAENLYTEWKRWAVENNYQEIKKKMHYIFYTEGYFSYFGNVKQDNNVRVFFAFANFKNDFVLIINLEEMTAGDNDHVKFNGGTMVFNSEKEIDDFLNIISPEAISGLKASKSENISN